jgi:hypothetical protein
MFERTRFVVLALASLLVLPASLQAQQTVKFTEYGFEDHPIDINTMELANGDTLTTGRFYHFVVPSTEGDHYSLVWTMDGWNTVAGTGKYENLQCDGKTVQTDQFTNVPGRFINESEMVCTGR